MRLDTPTFGFGSAVRTASGDPEPSSPSTAHPTNELPATTTNPATITLVIDPSAPGLRNSDAKEASNETIRKFDEPRRRLGARCRLNNAACRRCIHAPSPRAVAG